MSSGSDRDPTADAGKKIIKVLEKQLRAGCPAVLVCWTFQSVLMQFVEGSVQRLGRDQIVNSFHRFRGSSVASFHNFGVPKAYLPAVCYELQSFLRIQAGPSAGQRKPVFDIDSATYSHFGQELISFLCVQPLLYMSQFHPEVSVQGRTPLVESWVKASLALETHRRVGAFFNTQMDLGFMPAGSSAATSLQVQKEINIRKALVFAPPEADQGLVQALADLCAAVLEWAVQNLPAKWLSTLRSRARTSGTDRICVFFTPCSRIRRTLALGNSWPRASDINSGFQPDNLLHVHLFRKTGAFEVLPHEVLHMFLPARSTAAVISSPAAVEVKAFLAPGSVFRPEEAFLELLSNIYHIQSIGGALALVPGLRNLEKWVKAKCSVLAASRNRASARIEQQSCIFSYFFLRSALLNYVLSNCEDSSRTVSRFVSRTIMPLNSPDLLQRLMYEALDLLLEKGTYVNKDTFLGHRGDEGISPPAQKLLL